MPGPSSSVGETAVGVVDAVEVAVGAAVAVGVAVGAGVEVAVGAGVAVGVAVGVDVACTSGAESSVPPSSFAVERDDVVGSGLFDVDRRDDRSVGLGRDREAVFVDVPGLHERIIVGPIAGVLVATGRRVPLVEPGEVVRHPGFLVALARSTHRPPGVAIIMEQ
jgi:hypothetical protein